MAIEDSVDGKSIKYCAAVAEVLQSRRQTAVTAADGSAVWQPRYTTGRCGPLSASHASSANTLCGKLLPILRPIRREGVALA